MGLQGWLHWAAWFAKYFSFLLIDNCFITTIFYTETSNGAVFNYTSPTIFFVFLMIYSTAVIWLCFAVSVFFSKGMCLRAYSLLSTKMCACVPIHCSPQRCALACLFNDLHKLTIKKLAHCKRKCKVNVPVFTWVLWNQEIICFCS